MTTYEKIKKFSTSGSRQNILRLVCNEIDELKAELKGVRATTNDLDRRTTGLMKVGGFRRDA